VPLSEDEERILTEIEQQLAASDPALAKQVRSTTVYTDGLRGVRWGIFGVVVGLAALLALLQVNVIASFVVGFGMMLVSAWHLDRSLRSLGRTGANQMRRKLSVEGLLGYFGVNHPDRGGPPHAGGPRRRRADRDDEPF
jgi:hypothetical protein